MECEDEIRRSDIGRLDTTTLSPRIPSATRPATGKEARPVGSTQLLAIKSAWNIREFYVNYIRKQRKVKGLSVNSVVQNLVKRGNPCRLRRSGRGGL